MFEHRDPALLGISLGQLQRLDALIHEHLASGRYLGAQVAVMSRGAVAFLRSYGLARKEPSVAITDDHLFLLFSGTKVLTMAGIWALAEEGRLSFHDRVAQHLPEFAQNGKGDITVLDVATHRAGYPSGDVSQVCWADHAQMRREVCDFKLEWPVGARTHYHVRSAHWTMAALIEAITGMDYRKFITNRVIAPLSLLQHIFLGVPSAQHYRLTELYDMPGEGEPLRRAEVENTAAYIEAGVPSSGGYATAVGMAAFYQMLAAGGRFGGTRLFSQRLVEYVTRNFTGEQIDGLFGVPMHRGLGPHLRGSSEGIRSLGTLASPRTFGQGGAGSSVCFADPDSGLSFAYLTNVRSPEPWHSDRLDRIANIVHASID
jgi:CubicO group peptidase (beta-lactamase class C family)